MGGLARRVSYIKAFRHRSNSEVPTLLVDAGNLFTDDRFSANQLPGEVMTKNKWVVKGYGDFHHDAANISYVDLPYLAELLRKDGYDKRVEEYPFIKRLISANVKPLDNQYLAPAPYLIREITLKRGAPGQKVRVGIVGLTEGKPAGPNNEKEYNYAGFQISDPFDTARKVLPELKQKTDFIVALAYMPLDQAQRLATENPEIDSLIGARQTTSMDEPQHFNRATITYAYNQTKYLGELRVYVKSDGSIENQMNRYVALDSTIPDDPGALEVVTAAHTEFTNEQNNVAQTNTISSKPLPLLGGVESPYAGGEKCAACHQTEYDIWAASRHSHAMATLEKKNQQFDNECIGCHVVGYQKGGFQSLYTTPQFANVQCEECHGPGLAHASNPSKGYGFVATPVGCMRCHKEPNDPDFDFAVYWPKIKH
jgi:2',3'-cyclic-nucleotide 2'-phosphodiesterase (5'-nucleotidase family)